MNNRTTCHHKCRVNIKYPQRPGTNAERPPCTSKGPIHRAGNLYLVGRNNMERIPKGAIERPYPRSNLKPKAAPPKGESPEKRGSPQMPANRRSGRNQENPPNGGEPGKPTHKDWGNTPLRRPNTGGNSHRTLPNRGGGGGGGRRPS